MARSSSSRPDPANTAAAELAEVVLVANLNMKLEAPVSQLSLVLALYGVSRSQTIHILFPWSYRTIWRGIHTTERLRASGPVTVTWAPPCARNRKDTNIPARRHPSTIKSKRCPGRRSRKKPTEEEELDEILHEDEDGRPHPDIPVDEGKDEYLRSLAEWTNIASELEQWALRLAKATMVSSSFCNHSPRPPAHLTLRPNIYRPRSDCIRFQNGTGRCGTVGEKRPSTIVGFVSSGDIIPHRFPDAENFQITDSALGSAARRAKYRPTATSHDLKQDGNMPWELEAITLKSLLKSLRFPQTRLRGPKGLGVSIKQPLDRARTQGGPGNGPVDPNFEIMITARLGGLLWERSAQARPRTATSSKQRLALTMRHSLSRPRSEDEDLFRRHGLRLWFKGPFKGPLLPFAGLTFPVGHFRRPPFASRFSRIASLPARVSRLRLARSSK
ncbi:hypothetical protein DFH94DRAFT_848073 [Russula ochroleuca]|uniref:Uncharacterized protein n=1 Tax=Russula ochroleuca TaxID=152965 RepID=A0A9P5MP95_9AGAM|nr:hypothetical protein DFH94DRAFT_848073 [Russula ochroleuca]